MCVAQFSLHLRVQRSIQYVNRHAFEIGEKAKGYPYACVCVWVGEETKVNLNYELALLIYMTWTKGHEHSILKLSLSKML